MTWLQLWDKIGKQPLRLTRQNEVMVKIRGMEFKCELVYADNGNYFYLVAKEPF